MSVVVTLAGTVTVAADGRVADERRLGGPQARLVFALLVLERHRPVRRDELADALWEDAPPATWHAALRGIVSRVRAFLAETGLDPGAVLPGGRGGYRLLLPTSAQVDVEVAVDSVVAAERELRRGHWPAAVRQAETARMIAGRPVLSDADHPRLMACRRELADVLVRALLVGSEAHERAGDHARAVAAAADAVAAAPFVEAAYLRLVDAHTASGNRAAALRAYERCRRLLADELGTRPSPELEARYFALLEDAGSAAVSSAQPPPAVPLPPWLDDGPAPLVGREEELARLLGAWRAAVAGRPHLSLVSGEPGIGKTRLAAALAAQVKAEGGVVLGGRCDDAMAVPYAPFVEALGRYSRAAPAALGSWLARLPSASALVRMLPTLADVVAVESDAVGDPVADRYVLFEAVVSLFADVGRAMPVLLVVDDVQWASPPTLLLLRHLLRSDAATRLFVVATVRDTEPGPGTAGAERLAEEVKPRTVVRIGLGGLPRPAVATLVRQQADQLGAGAQGPAEGLRSDDIATLVHAETAGNPLFVGEVVRAMLESGQPDRVPLTDDLRAMIGHRVAGLPESAQRLLSAAAVVGARFDPALVRDVAELGDEEFTEALELVERARLVEAPSSGADRYTFVHALVQAASVQALSTAARRRRHQRVGELLAERTHPQDLAGWTDVAHHLSEAVPLGSATAAVAASRRAGDLACDALGFEDAISHYRRALALLDRSRLPDDRLRCELEIALGEASVRAGEPRPRDLLLGAARRAHLLGDPDLLARTALALDPYGRFSQFGATDRDVVDVLDAAVMAQDGHRVGQRARLLAALSIELMWTPDHARAGTAIREAVDLARVLGDPATLGHVLVRKRLAPLGPGETEGVGMALADELDELGRRLGDPELVLVSHQLRFDTGMELGEIDLARDALARAGRLAAELHQPQHNALVSLCRTGLALFEGRVDVAERLMAEGLDHYQAAGASASAAAAVATAQLFMLALERGTLPALAPAAEELVRSQPAVTGWRAGLAYVRCVAGDRDKARVLLDEVAAAGFDSIPRNLVWSTTLLLLADTAAALGEAEHAVALYNLLLPLAGRNAWAGAFSYGPIDRGLAVLAMTLGQPEAARLHGLAAVEQCKRWGAAGWQQRSHDVLVELGD